MLTVVECKSPLLIQTDASCSFSMVHLYHGNCYDEIFCVLLFSQPTFGTAVFKKAQQLFTLGNAYGTSMIKKIHEKAHTQAAHRYLKFCTAAAHN